MIISKNFIFLTAVACFVHTVVVSSCLAEGTEKADSTSLPKVDHAIPDAPALILLNVSEDKILRPASMQELVAAINVKDGFAVELSPYRLGRGEKVTLEDYRESLWHRFLYNVHLSIGLVRGDDNSVETAAFGARFNIVNGADFRTRKLFTDSLQSILTAAIRMETPDPTGMLSEADSVRIEEFLNTQISNLITRFSDSTWNDWIVQFAFASALQSQDSIGTDPSFFKHAVWLTAGGPISTFGQWLLGVTSEAEKDFTRDVWIGNGTVAGRIYLGSNRYKFFAEGQGTFSSPRRPTWLANTGGEFALTKDLWFEGSIGWEKGGELDKGRLVTSYDVKYTFDVSGSSGN